MLCAKKHTNLAPRQQHRYCHHHKARPRQDFAQTKYNGRPRPSCWLKQNHGTCLGACSRAPLSCSRWTEPITAEYDELAHSKNGEKSA
eukprot:4960680-Pleurochrysis_carterae.AAC.5